MIGQPAAGRWPELEKELVLEFEYTSWPILSDEALNKLIQVRARRVLVGAQGISRSIGRSVDPTTLQSSLNPLPPGHRPTTPFRPNSSCWT